MGGIGHPYKTLEEKMRFHRKRIKYHQDRLAEWERIVAEIQQLHRLEQVSAETDLPQIARAKKNTSLKARNDFARELLMQAGKAGITPAEIRQRANENGISTPNNFPYKMFKVMKERGKIEKDEKTGRYRLTGREVPMV
jgi:hypothetical protein